MKRISVHIEFKELSRIHRGPIYITVPSACGWGDMDSGESVYWVQVSGGGRKSRVGYE